VVLYPEELHREIEGIMLDHLERLRLGAGQSGRPTGFLVDKRLLKFTVSKLPVVK
jgi:hypothetical protein